jgi:hypothetical protein
MQHAIKIDNYLLQDRIGAGCSSDVYRGFDPKAQKFVALKLLKPDCNTMFANEANFFRCVPRHPNIIDHYYTMDKGLLFDSVSKKLVK